MSREQWGHGYHKGLVDAFNATSNKRWGITFDENGQYAECFRTIKEFPDGTYLAEHWNYFDMLTFCYAGWEPSEEIDQTALIEFKLPEDQIQFFYTFEAMRSQWILCQNPSYRRQH